MERYGEERKRIMKKTVRKRNIVNAAILVFCVVVFSRNGKAEAWGGGDWIQRLWESAKPILEYEWGISLGSAFPVVYPNLDAYLEFPPYPVYPVYSIEGAWGVQSPRGDSEVIAFLGNEYILVQNGWLRERGFYQIQGDIITLGIRQGGVVVNGPLLQLRIPGGGVYQRLQWF
jgi:hypothetical protein